jgi:hypothetical protein
MAKSHVALLYRGRQASLAKFCECQLAVSYPLISTLGKNRGAFLALVACSNA